MTLPHNRLNDQDFQFLAKFVIGALANEIKEFMQDRAALQQQLHGTNGTVDLISSLDHSKMTEVLKSIYDDFCTNGDEVFDNYQDRFHKGLVEAARDIHADLVEDTIEVMEFEDEDLDDLEE